MFDEDENPFGSWEPMPALKLLEFNLKNPQWLEIPGESLVYALSRQFTHCSFAVAGGAVRDTLHGRTPKDVDIIIAGAENWSTPILSFLAVWGWVIEASFDCYGNQAVVGEGDKLFEKFNHTQQDEELEPDERLDFVAKLSHPAFQYKVDLIFYIAEYGTIESILASFDHTIGQFAVTFSTERLFKLHVPENIGICSQVRGQHVTQARKDRIQEICTKLGWEYQK